MTAPHAITAVIGAVMLLLSACSMHRWPDASTPPPVETREPRDARQSDVYRVVRGDTLYSIAWRSGNDFRALARWNNIAPPYQIFPGQTLQLKEPGRGVGATASVDSSGTSEASRSVAPQHKVPAKRRGYSVKYAAPASWLWPHDGDILNVYAPNSPGRKGIDIAGRIGETVVATASGKVVYSGSGLSGYGQLIIIKHDETYLSAYGHNSRLLVKEGDEVRAGQRIAELGDTDAERPMLHFEIRRNGEPVDPVAMLPKRKR